jgi:hypothetical protein
LDGSNRAGGASTYDDNIEILRDFWFDSVRHGRSMNL